MKKEKKKFRYNFKCLRVSLTSILAVMLALALTGCSLIGGGTGDSSSSTIVETMSSQASSSKGSSQSESSSGGQSVVEDNETSQMEVVTENIMPTETTAYAELSAELSEYYTDRDVNGTYDESEATVITLSGSSASASGTNASAVSASNGVVTITEKGTYILTGSLDGQVIVSADDAAKVQLVLQNATISCEDSAAIWIQSADKVFLTLADGTTNTVKTGDSFDLANGEDEPDAGVFSKEDLTINGSGTLIVDTGYQDGVVSKDDLKICGGTIVITAEDDGIRGKDSVRILDGDITITTNSGNGIKATNEEESDRGYIRIAVGTSRSSAARTACTHTTISR